MKTPERIASDLIPGYPNLQALIADAIRADRAQRTRKVHIVFDGPPEHVSGRFVETETPDGNGISLGRWIERVDGYWALEIEVPA